MAKDFKLYNSKKISLLPSEEMKWLNYYDKGAYDLAIDVPKNMTLWDRIESKLKEYYDVPAIEYFNRIISRDDFIESVYEWAKVFKELGVEEDDVVPIYGPFFPDIAAMLFALNVIGASGYCLKLAIDKDSLNQETDGCKVAVVFNDMYGNVKDVFDDARFKKVVIATAYDSMPRPKKEIVKFISNIQKLKNGSLISNDKNKFIWADDAKKMCTNCSENLKVPFKANRNFIITSSSGTTVGGVVKGTPVTNETALSQLAILDNSKVNYCYGDSCLLSFPPTASTATFCQFILPLDRGMSLIMDPRISSEQFYKLIMSEKPSVAIGTGVFWEVFFLKLQKEILSGKKVDLSFMKMPIMGGEGTTVKALEWMNKMLKDCGNNYGMRNGYGMSEMFSVLCVEKPYIPMTDREKEKPYISVGFPFPGNRVGIFDKNGKELGYNEKGEIWIQSKSIMPGYYKKPELTEKTIVDGWLRTGDVGEISESGRLYVLGRKSNLIYQANDLDIYSFDIENVIKENKNIKDAIITQFSLGGGDVAINAHIIIDENSTISKAELYKQLDDAILSRFSGIIKVNGYLVHDKIFDYSPTTIKIDRNKLSNILSGYEKINDDNLVDDVSYSFNDGYFEEKSKSAKKLVLK